MEIRRVQITGGSSYVITLPKNWIKSLNIKKNDSLAIKIQPDGTLLVSPKITDEQNIKEKKINSDKITKNSFLLRRLIAAYISGYNSINVGSNNRISPQIRTTVRLFSQNAIGQEIVEETDKSIIIKDLLKPAEMPFSSTIKRMHIIVKSMHDDAMSILTSGDNKIVEEILLRDNDIDRLHLLVARQHNILLQNMNLAEKMNLSTPLTSAYYLISRIIERMGDHVVRIAQNASKLADIKLRNEILDKIHIASKLAFDIFNNSIGSFFRKDINSSNQNIETVDRLGVICNEINEMALEEEGAIAISIGYIVESIRRIGEYAQDISETSINYLIEDN